MSIQHKCDACKQVFDPKKDAELRASMPIDGFIGLFLRGTFTIGFTPHQGYIGKEACRDCILKGVAKAIRECPPDA